MKKIYLLFLIFISACQSATPIVEVIPTSTNILQATETATALPTQMPPSPTVIPSPTLEAIRISAKDGMTQLFIPAGKFTMGGLDVQRENDELPAHEVYINAFWIDQVEVTNGMYNLCVQSGECNPPVQIRSDNRNEYFGNPEFQDYPVVYVTWGDANQYCTWAGRRLPSEAEWERAARGDDKRNYPWGDELPNEYNSNSQNFIGDTSRVGSYAEGASPFGALDMAGNVWEWVADFYRMDYYAKSPTENPPGPLSTEVFTVMRVIRGGSFQDDGLDLRVSNRNFIEGPNPKEPMNNAKFYGKSSAKIGFRCAADE